jgi:hypothetical protein
VTQAARGAPHVAAMLHRMSSWGRARSTDLARVRRFLAERAQFTVRADDIFISSYPRSGTTWLQHISHVLVHEGDTGFAHIEDVVPWFERSLALGQHRASDFARMPSPRLFKSHLPYAWLPRGARYIYALRDGRDVAVSYYQFYRSHLGFDGDFQTFFARFLRGDLQYRSWFDHVDGWSKQAGNPSVLLVPYERMLSDLSGSLGEIAAFCGIDRSHRRLAELRPVCSFDYMKRNEHRFDHARAAIHGPVTRPGQFIRNGQHGSFAQWFDADQLRAFERRARRHRRLAGLEFDLPAFLH